MLAGAFVVLTVACGGGSEQQSTGPEVMVKDIAFKPSRVSVEVGGDVSWAFEDDVAHNITAEDGSFKSQDLSKGTFHHRFAAAGSFRYLCTIHPAQMRGSVDVRA